MLAETKMAGERHSGHGDQKSASPIQAAPEKGAYGLPRGSVSLSLAAFS